MAAQIVLQAMYTSYARCEVQEYPLKQEKTEERKRKF
jgi:hypothetical protein